MISCCQRNLKQEIHPTPFIKAYVVIYFGLRESWALVTASRVTRGNQNFVLSLFIFGDKMKS